MTFTWQRENVNLYEMLLTFFHTHSYDYLLIIILKFFIDDDKIFYSDFLNTNLSIKEFLEDNTLARFTWGKMS